MSVLSVDGTIISRHDTYKITYDTVFKVKKKSVKNISIEYEKWRYGNKFLAWKKRQWSLQNSLCFYCKHDLRIMMNCVEHVIPRSKGGTNNKNNLVLACKDCNKFKGSGMPNERWIDLAKKMNKKQK